MTFAARRRGGGAGAVLNLNNMVLFARDSIGPSYEAWVYLQVNNDGDVYIQEGTNNAPSSLVSDQTWISGGTPTDYSARLVKTTGSDPDVPTSDTLSTWEPLTGDVFWGWSASGEGNTANFTGILSIALTADPTKAVLASCTVSVEVICGIGV